MRFLLALLVFIPAFAVSADETKDVYEDLKSIIGSTRKESEKPVVEKDVCGSPCGKNFTGEASDCGNDMTVFELESRATVIKDVMTMLKGDNFALKKNLKVGKVAIFQKGQGSKAFIVFDLKDGSFIGRMYSLAEDEDRRFVREYRLLERIYKELKFKELCQYLSSNDQKYLTTLKKLSQQ